jgi:hypothetical protein
MNQNEIVLLLMRGERLGTKIGEGPKKIDERRNQHQRAAARPPSLHVNFCVVLALRFD